MQISSESNIFAIFISNLCNSRKLFLLKIILQGKEMFLTWEKMPFRLCKSVSVLLWVIIFISHAAAGNTVFVLFERLLVSP